MYGIKRKFVMDRLHYIGQVFSEQGIRRRKSCRENIMKSFQEARVNIYNQGNHTYRNLHDQYGFSSSTLRQTESFSAKNHRTEQGKE